jgi:hypothetical protein
MKSSAPAGSPAGFSLPSAAIAALLLHRYCEGERRGERDCEVV